MSFADYEEFFLQFFQPIVFLGLVSLLVAALVLAVIIIVRAIDEQNLSQ